MWVRCSEADELTCLGGVCEARSSLARGEATLVERAVSSGARYDAGLDGS